MNVLFRLRVLFLVWKALKRADLTNFELSKLISAEKLEPELVDVFRRLGEFIGWIGW